MDKVTNIKNFPFSEKARNNALFRATWTDPAGTTPHCSGADATSDVTVNANSMETSGICDKLNPPIFSKSYISQI